MIGQWSPSSRIRVEATLRGNVHGLRDGGIVAENSAPGNPALAPQVGNVSPDDPSEQLAIFTPPFSII